jgi:hypothetical protein
MYASVFEYHVSKNGGSTFLDLEQSYIYYRV